MCILLWFNNSHWASVFQTGEQEFYRIPMTNVLVSVIDKYKSLTLAIHNHCVLKPKYLSPLNFL